MRVVACFEGAKGVLVLFTGFGLLSGALYLPLELYELTQALTWPRLTVFCVNMAIVSYLLKTGIATGGRKRG